MSVSLVVPSWNGEHLLKRNLPSLVAAMQGFPGEAELIVVVDGGDDGSSELVRREFPMARLVVHEENRGFSEACLSGVRAARHPLVALLNSDVSVEPDFLAPLVACFRHPEVFASTPLLLDEDGSFNDLSLRVPYISRGRIRFRRSAVQQLWEDPAARRLHWYTFYPLGGACVLDRARFLELGGFDPLFHPFYYEDQDLGFRAWRRGWTCVAVPESRVTHASSSTIRRFFPTRDVNRTRKRNRVLFLCKNFTTNRLLYASLAYQPLRLLLSLLRLDLDQVRGTLAALPRLDAAFAGRRAEQAAAVRSEREIFATIEQTWRCNLARLRSEGDA